eukprot:156902-Pelagomonas_calceolata.AAC.1
MMSHSPGLLLEVLSGLVAASYPWGLLADEECEERFLLDKWGACPQIRWCARQLPAGSSSG